MKGTIHQETKGLLNKNCTPQKREIVEDIRRWNIFHACGLGESTL
jgi:hypothetical protein